MFLWIKSADPCWVKAHEGALQARTRGQLVIMRRPGRKRLRLEIACRSRSDSSGLRKEFGGRIETLPRNWLERFASGASNPIRIGKRLRIVRSLNEDPQSRLSRSAKLAASTRLAMVRTINPALLVIPASMAFGTGEHATTAMSLRFLEQLTRRWKREWSLLDLGTGSGILALAAKRFGATRVIGIDNDPAAISVARSNARLNQIRGATFQPGNVCKWKSARETDVITANLYSDLLIEILPKLRATDWLILSGILCNQQEELIRALQANDFDVMNTKRRGKWLAILARQAARV